MNNRAEKISIEGETHSNKMDADLTSATSVYVSPTGQWRNHLTLTLHQYLYFHFILEESGFIEC